MSLSSFTRRAASIVSIFALGVMLSPAPLLAAPVISEVSPATVTSNVSATMSATVNSSVALQICKLYIDLDEVGQMSVSGNMVSMPYTFTNGGSHVAFVFCRDTDGNAAAGPNTAIWVNGAINQSVPFSGGEQTPPASNSNSGGGSSGGQVNTPSTPPPQATGALIKLACADGATVDDPCHAVYYRSTDGKRHAFPNSKVFFTWYSNFDSVITVTPAEMGSSLLGKNVTYRPASRMVKFETVNHVYAVAQGGLLRWVTSEAVATALYGSDWNTKIDDIPDTFYGNYSFGTDIKEANDYNITTELGAGANIETSL